MALKKHHIFSTCWRPQASPHPTTYKRALDRRQAVEYNGQRALVTEIESAPGRVTVELLRSGRQMSLRRDKLRVMVELSESEARGRWLGKGGWGMKWDEHLEISRESRKSSCFSWCFRVFSMFFQWFCWFVGGFWSRDMLKDSKFFLSNGFLDNIITGWWFGHF